MELTSVELAQSIDRNHSVLSRDIIDRIARITDSSRTESDLRVSVCGSLATRESRMEVVAWVAICKFDCSLEGGFVRDWIVANECVRPSSSIPMSKWVVFDSTTGTPSLIKTLVPSDLDCKMSLNSYFDIERFCHEVNKLGLQPTLHRSRRSFRLLFDEYGPTGPFIMDLIEPYKEIGFSIPDLDVNNLYLRRDHSAQLNQRMALDMHPWFIDLRQIIENIQHKQFRVIPLVDELIAERIKKMVMRGWTQKGLSLINRPQRIAHEFTTTLLPTSSDIYKRIENEMQTIVGARILKIEEIYNPVLENVYESMKKLVADQCPDGIANERILYHGSHTTKANSIMLKGFDYGFFKIHSRFGTGAYFAEAPLRSHEYTLTADDNPTRNIFLCRVVLGREKAMAHTNSELCFAPGGYHSVRSVIFDSAEYIVYRFTQALPFVRIIYQTSSMSQPIATSDILV